MKFLGFYAMVDRHRLGVAGTEKKPGCGRAQADTGSYFIRQLSCRSRPFRRFHPAGPVVLFLIPDKRGSTLTDPLFHGRQAATLAD